MSLDNEVRQIVMAEMSKADASIRIEMRSVIAAQIKDLARPMIEQVVHEVMRGQWNGGYKWEAGEDEDLRKQFALFCHRQEVVHGRSELAIQSRIRKILSEELP
uniref:Uncharacterized protein n=1 Tax=viral metagenome TaxID=1070528 RepID=A0A6M3IKL9_9ZZZZ